MADKKEMVNKKKYDGFAIASFIIALVSPIILLSIVGLYFIGLIAFGLASILSIIFGIIALKRISDVSSKGKILAILGILIPILLILSFLIK